MLVTHDSRGGVDAVGDVVNTASRLESAAPAGRMLVDSHTYRSTQLRDPVRAGRGGRCQGQERPVEAWLAVQARSIVPEQTRISDLPLVGREAEHAILRGALDRCRRESATQLVTVAGPPGIGKTRLAEDLGDYVETAADLITWRRGRSLVLRRRGRVLGAGRDDQARRLASSIRTPAQVAAEKLGVAVAELISDEGDRDWVTRHLRPLVGLDRAVLG